MKSLEERIKKGIEAIASAKSEGRDTGEWEKHLFGLIHQLAEEKKTVKVRMGTFGFCTCPLGKALCSGCWRVLEACTCKELDVDPEAEITKQYAQSLKRVGVH
ncbi:MAG TPA: hypothetical protein VHT73_19240 [Thermodesulfobacteriota bacterium]|nr:hypothetical protein [Thermodesulfobacteriota bacterium]